MGTKLAADERDAIIQGSPLCRDDHSGDFGGAIVPPDRAWFALMVRQVWPVKASMAICQYTGCAERTARSYTSADREPSASILRGLLRGGEGDAILAALMRDKPPAWWLRQEREAAIGRKVLALVEGVINGNAEPGQSAPDRSMDTGA